MQNFLLKLKAFNSRHKKIVPFIIVFEILAIIIVSIYKNMSKVTRAITLALAAILIIVFLARHFIPANPRRAEAEGDDSVIVGEVAADEAVVETSVLVTEVIDEDNGDLLASVAEDSNKDTSQTQEKAAENSSEDNIVKFMKDYPESVGWIWFEDDLINYPIMQADDNSKYALKDYQGADSNTGAIFLDYRASADFNDSNTFIYGHNMRDRSMFGALKYYKEDLGFLEDHKYFQIITPECSRRYMIFAFMDVPKDSYIYNVIGQNPSNMREFLDTIEYKTYIDTGIEPTVDDKIITLSTCTESDDLYFVMFAVEVE